MEEQLPSFGQRGDHDLEPSKVLRNESLVSSKLNAPNYYKSPSPNQDFYSGQTLQQQTLSENVALAGLPVSEIEKRKIHDESLTQEILTRTSKIEELEKKILRLENSKPTFDALTGVGKNEHPVHGPRANIEEKFNHLKTQTVVLKEALRQGNFANNS